MGQEGLHLGGKPFCLLLCGGIRRRLTKAPSSLPVQPAGGGILNYVTYDTFVRIFIKILFLLLFINECLGQEPGGQSTDGSQEHQRGKGPCPGLGQARLLGKGKQRPGDQLEQRPTHEDRGRQDAAQAAHHAIAEALPAGGIAHGAGTVGRDAQPQRNDEQQGHAQAGAAQAQGRSGDAGQQAGQDHGLAAGLEALFADPGQKRRPGDEAHGAHGQDVADEAGRKAEGPAHVDRAPKAVEHEIGTGQGKKQQHKPPQRSVCRKGPQIFPQIAGRGVFLPLRFRRKVAYHKKKGGGKRGGRAVWRRGEFGKYPDN